MCATDGCMGGIPYGPGAGVEVGAYPDLAVATSECGRLLYIGVVA